MGARLRRRQDFRMVLRAGRRYANRLVALYVLSGGDGPARLGVTTGRRIGTAVTRNRVRRRLREAYRAHGGELAPGVDAVLVGRSEAALADFGCLTGAVLDVLCRAGLISREDDARP
ncbi:MAG: ribonuclease P protein component [bacterium]|nr:ribonuclease P protein component [bacterium]